MSETADLSVSSDNERNPPSSRATSSMSRYSITQAASSESPDVIVILDSDDEDKMYQNSPVVNHVVKGEPKSEEIPQAIKRDFFLSHTLRAVYSLITTGSRSISPDIQFLPNFSAGITKVNRKISKGKSTGTVTLPKPSGPIKLTSKLTVDSISTTTSLPSTWTVPRDNSATLVDLSALDSLPRKRNGDGYSIDALIRAEVCLK
jgi:hypothetical protein